MESPPTEEQYHDVARRLIDRINGLACVLHPGFTPVELTDAYQHDDAVSVVLGTAHLRIRKPIVSGTGVAINPDAYQAPPPTQPGPGYLALAAKDSDLAEVLRIMAAAPHFPELYKVMEIIEATGCMATAMKAAGISRNRMTNFTRTADHQAASGDHSRHARSKTQPPPKPMSITEARAMIGNVVTAWMLSL